MSNFSYNYREGPDPFWPRNGYAHIKILKKANKTHQKARKKRFFFHIIKDGCGLCGRFDFDFDAVKKILNLKLQNVIIFFKKVQKRAEC